MGKYINIMTKVSPATAERLDRIKERGGFRSKYEVVQAAVALMLKYADAEGEPLDPDEVEQVRSLQELFGSLTAVRDSLARVKPNGGKKIEPSALVAFYGKECLMLKALDAEGNSSTTTNVRDVLELVMSKTLPADTLQRLRLLQRKAGYPTLLSVLMAVVASANVEATSQEVLDMFAAAAEADPTIVPLGLENKPARAKSIRKFD